MVCLLLPWASAPHWCPYTFQKHPVSATILSPSTVSAGPPYLQLAPMCIIFIMLGPCHLASRTSHMLTLTCLPMATWSYWQTSWFQIQALTLTSTSLPKRIKIWNEFSKGVHQIGEENKDLSYNNDVMWLVGSFGIAIMSLYNRDSWNES